jgi:outer membrane protein assembly factor BamA
VAALLLVLWMMAEGAAAPLAPAEAVVERWALSGDRLIDEEEAAALFAPGTPPDRAAALLAARLRSAGWWGARVTPSGGPPVATLEVNAGEPVVVGEVHVHGNRVFTREEILSRVETRPGRTFDEAVFRGDVERILRAYSEAGRPLARVYPSRFQRTEGGRLGFTLRIGEGPEATVESVRVFGRTATADAVVARIGGVRPGDPWNVRRFEGMSARLRREGLFRTVGEARLVRGSRDNLVGVEIEVEEGRANSFAGVLGYNPDPQGGGEVVGLVHLDLRNILGTARRASLRFERQSPEFRDLSFRYREPWLLGTPLSAELGAAQSLRDPFYSRTDLDAGLSVPIGDRSTVTVAAERRETSFDDASGADVSETSTGGSASLVHDARDRRLNPGSGWAGRLLLGARETEDGVLRSRAETDLHVLVPAGSAWVFSEELGFRGVRSTSGSPPLSEQYYLGGTNTVRGWREEQFHGDRVWWARSELRYRLSLRSRAYLFADVGGWRFGSDAATPGDSDVIPGGGVGVSLETRSSGFVRFELALGRGDGFSDAKVHAALEQEF